MLLTVRQIRFADGSWSRCPAHGQPNFNGRITLRKIFSLVSIVLTLTSPLAALGADNSLGTWKVNVAASKYTPAPWPVKTLTAVREAVPGGVKGDDHRGGGGGGGVRDPARPERKGDDDGSADDQPPTM